MILAAYACLRVAKVIEARLGTKWQPVGNGEIVAFMTIETQSLALGKRTILYEMISARLCSLGLYYKTADGHHFA